MGDFNAMIGNINTGYEDVMGQQGIGEMDHNGERFADLCATADLVIGGGEYFPAQEDSQSYMGLTGHENDEPNRPCMYL